MHESFHCSELSMLSQVVLCTEQMVAVAGGWAVVDGMWQGVNEMIPSMFFSLGFCTCGMRNVPYYMSSSRRFNRGVAIRIFPGKGILYIL